MLNTGMNLQSNRKQMENNALLEKVRMDNEETVEKLKQQLANANKQLSEANMRLEECNRKLTNEKELTSAELEGKLCNA